ncbi:Guanine nucleotide-binding protein subunit beta [Schizosaccharomyces pombe]|uniref:Guanine nucleotide-binding protein subunit beta n=1 Tax=Schizosaccharomyces pombe (strain 972 / ATCC 24843) TaxID=284812 RepID=GBB_SCHPO|nr:heterotrimeric G protein beta subunit Git5 [Schizosaccharomyces pombe]Q10282.2 RecName: Full=Guanine nucleotide-binding protein subunit beta [Schizosaccharomyces pombe 972h-]AAD09020.1 G-protein beta subunit git5p [Schizosaccharomyces pombe]BAA21396.1 G protein beta subunit [Schizosaccharomyces pombe]CAC37497.1 heterotrimeric G protein beta subunit Git5 [Schizosaccharomyces pombe]|eukprot:NP_595613.1 heterotrimeric G protein beta subunit Git5 [Schizosaccharomyces pombe]
MDSGSRVNVNIQGTRVLKNKLGKIPDIDISTDGKYLLSASTNDVLLVWDLHTSNKVAFFEAPSVWIMTCAFSPSTKSIAAGGLNNFCVVYDTSVPDADPVELVGHAGFVSCCKYVDDGHLLTGSGDKTCMFWDIEQAKAISVLKGHEMDIVSLDFLPSNPNLFVTGGCDKLAKLWDLRAAYCCATFPGNTSDINSISFFPSNADFVTGAEDGIARCFDIRASAEIFQYSSPSSSPINSVLFSKSGKLLFIAKDKTCEVWDSISSKTITSLTGHENRISSLALTSDGTMLATGSWDECVRLWSSSG